MTKEYAPFVRADAFEWDENKRRLNVIKHGIDFDDAKDVFYDPAACTFPSMHTVEHRLVTIRFDARRFSCSDIDASRQRHSDYFGPTGPPQ